MKIAFLCDTHSGARNDNDFYIHHQNHFYDNVFFPTLERENVDVVFHAGDLLDKRRAINIKSLAALNKHYIYRLIAEGYDYYQLLGNHDIYYKNTRWLSAIREIYGPLEGDHFHIISDPTLVDIGGLKILLMPWIVPDEEENITDIMFREGGDATMCVGHFELNGFQMNRGGKPMTGAMDRSLLDQFKIVLSGHYHTGAFNKNVMYIGSPFQMTFADQDDRKKFMIFDTETFKMQFIYNDDHVFQQFDYTDGLDLDAIEFGDYQDINVKVIVNAKGNQSHYEDFMDRMNAVGPFTLTVVDRYVFESDDDTELETMDKGTEEILIESVDDYDFPPERVDPVKQVLSEIYNQALAE